jgi:superfamily II DNA or RNA helicase/HKD family nuclease
MNKESLAYEIIEATKTGFIDQVIDSSEKLRPKLLVNDYSKGNKVLSNIVNEMQECDYFQFSVAFITMSGITVLLETLKDLEQRGIHGRILTTNYLNFNEPKALKRLLDFKNLEVKIFDKENFHTKGYIFKKENCFTFIVGSSNLTQSALTANKEWNIRITSLENGELIKETLSDFENLWDQAIPLTLEWIETEYTPVYIELKNIRSKLKVSRIKQYTLKPNSMQKAAMRALDELRKENKDKALLISATGTGKTYLSAFDVRNVNPKKLLYLVHRERILKQAIESYKDVMGEELSVGLLSGSVKEYDADYLFSTVWMMSKPVVHTRFAADYFDYIIIDETHKAGAESYQRVLDYFKPKFLLGMTATPDRTDDYDIYNLYNHNIAYEIRLQQAMEEDLLCPFHYFGITELQIDGLIIDDSTEFRHLISEERVVNIIKQAEFYGYSGNRVKGLIFCSRKEEAKELSRLFNQRSCGITGEKYHTLALSGDDNDFIREDAISRLEQIDLEGSIDYIFTVDIFNEGIDIPCVNQVIMLRPTESSIIFIQQLGRGLRKQKDKEYVVVIDFIGNYQKNFLIPIALSGDKNYNKDTIRKYVAEGNRVIPGCSTINFDAISKERIYSAIDNANFSDIELIKTEYRNLKNMIGRIPKYEDFEHLGSIDMMRIFENKRLGSYHNFLKKYEKNYNYADSLTEVQEEMLLFISQKIANGKRVYELKLLKRLLTYQERIFTTLGSDNSISYEGIIKENVIKVLTNEFVTSKTMLKNYKNSVFIEQDQDDYSASAQFKNAVKNQVFVELLTELIDYGTRRYEMYYSQIYKQTEFELYMKYTYEDVCKLLNWDKNIVALNIGGYKYDEKTNTLPVFINYDKGEEISNSIKYNDRFESPSTLIALSKQPRSIDSNDARVIYDSRTKIYLFVRKNKDDKISKEFYFLGEVHAVGRPKPVVIDSKDAFEISYKLEDPVREDIYEYIIN